MKVQHVKCEQDVSQMINVASNYRIDLFFFPKSDRTIHTFVSENFRRKIHSGSNITSTDSKTAQTQFA